MIISVITGPTFIQAKIQIEKAIAFSDMLEFRLDYFEAFEMTEVNDLKNSSPLPVIFTLRSSLEGGKYLNQEQQKQKIEEYCFLKPGFFDLEASLPLDFINSLMEKFSIKWIISSHQFTKTKNNQIPKITNTHTKRAVQVENITECLELFEKYSDDVVIGMGKEGVISRILAKKFGRWATYACIDEPIVEGQLTARELEEIYRYGKINKDTKIYALIGNPVEQSIGHIYHNAYFEKFNKNAVYIKMLVQEEELEKLFYLVKKLNFSGLSVTMPYKEKCIQYLDEMDEESIKIGAVNTIVIKDGKMQGFNTDGKAALNLIEAKTAKKNMLIVGVGGAAKAAIYEAKKRGFSVTIANRNEKKGEKVAEEFDSKTLSLNLISSSTLSNYDCIVFAIPELDLHPLFTNEMVVLDMNIKETSYFILAKKAGCQVISGKEMFEAQAKMQQDLFY